jgi:hypothetical protein
MDKRSERPLALALICSSIIHLLLVAVYLHGYVPGSAGSAPYEAASSIAVALEYSGSDTPATESAPSETSEKPDKPAESSPPAPPFDVAEPGPVEPLRPYPVEQIAEIPVDLNPVPLLREEFSIDMAMLAVRAPMPSEQQASLKSALNHFSERLPEWTDPSEPLRWRDGGQEYRIRVQHQQPASATELERAVLEVSTEMGGIALSARLPVKRVAFSHFAQVVDRWSPDVSLAGDRIVGRFHSNSELWVQSNRGSAPLVTGPTTVAGRVNLNGRTRKSVVFPSGLETRARRMPLPREAFPWEEISPGKEHIHFIEENARVIFAPEGGYDWYPATRPGAITRVNPTQLPWLIIARSGVELEVQGTVRGSVLVYSPRRISITGDLNYSTDPRERDDSTDFLGLVSDRNVEVAGPELTGAGDVELFASVYAGRQFRVRRHRDRNAGQLLIYGSVTSGSLSATEPRFTTHLEFDPRLEEQRAAYFPMTNRYVLDGPEPAWTIETATAGRD